MIAAQLARVPAESIGTREQLAAALREADSNRRFVLWFASAAVAPAKWATSAPARWERRCTDLGEALRSAGASA